ncbi:ammonium transporter 2-like isoform X2 [Corticium candelabrum]|uniref:ammonium transporter 2-like isoform X2 n=1 Tax=Corticium candelabrum TaxID=121492 RepID=UPI002E265223|nr:ammonium transporter 2-like isoform X2 [Corticium candelabrum]
MLRMSNSSSTYAFPQVNLKYGNNFYNDKYTDASAGWAMVAAILIFFMKAGFLFVETTFLSEETHRGRVVVSKYLDTCSSAVAFWLFGFAFSIGLNPAVLGEDQDYILWFFRFTFASNTATIIGGTLIGETRKMKLVAVLLYSFMISSIIHPAVAYEIWSEHGMWSPFKFCNGTIGSVINGTITLEHILTERPSSMFVLDFAGSGAVHLLGGMGGLLLTLCFKVEQWLDAREKKFNVQEQELDSMRDENEFTCGKEKSEIPMPTKNFLEWMYHVESEIVEYAALGVLILWTSWFAFNCGSAESISGGTDGLHSFKIYHAVVGRIALNMVVCAGSGGLLAIGIAGFVQVKMKADRINTNEIANGILSCLVAITGCCAFVRPFVAFGIGIFAILFYHLGCYIEFKLDLKDTARVVPVHAWSGMLGLLASCLADNTYLREVYENVCFCQELNLSDFDIGFGLLLRNQLVGMLLIIVWSVATIGPLFLLLSLVRCNNIAKLLRKEPFPTNHVMWRLVGGGALLTLPYNTKMGDMHMDDMDNPKMD